MTSTVTFHVGDVRDVLASMPDDYVDCLITSPPFLALRSYLPIDHVDKHREIGSEPTPAAFLDTMLALTADWRRVVTPTGSIAVEIGDTYSGSGGGGGDYLPGGLREDQPGFGGSAERQREGNAAHWRQKNAEPGGWPLAKSLCGIPTLYPWSLAYGRNLLTGADSPAGQWRIRNLLTWTRPNPPVGALGDKYRPATSYVTVACTSDKRWFDLDSVRGDAVEPHLSRVGMASASKGVSGGDSGNPDKLRLSNNPAGAPPLDWWDANDCEPDGTEAWQPLHRLPTQPYKGSHYAAFPVALPRRLIESMCPLSVCVVCGEARRRIVDVSFTPHGIKRDENKSVRGMGVQNGEHAQAFEHGRATKNTTTLGWTDCGHDDYRPGIVADPFGGSGTTAVAAALCGRDAVLIDIDHRNVDLTRRRLGEQMLIVNETTNGDTVTWTVDPHLPGTKGEAEGQGSLFSEMTA